MKRLALSLAALCIAVLVARSSLDSGSGTAVFGDDIAWVPVVPSKVKDVPGAILAAPGDESGRRASVAELGATNASPPFASRADHPWTPLLAAVTGRVVESDGTPLPGRRVRLSELLDNERDMAAPHPFGEGSLVVGEDTTDSSGKYTIRGALSDRLHLVSVDPHGTTAISRLIYQSLEPGGTVKLDDLVVRVHSRVTGRVVGPDGEPVVGAKVELLEDCDELSSAFYGMVPRDDGPFGNALPAPPRSEAGAPTPLPVFRHLGGRFLDAYQQWARSTVLSGDDGRFTIESGLSGSLRAFASCEELTPALSVRIEGSADGDDLGDLQLGRHPRLRGRVIDHDGTPVEGAEVRAAPVNMAVGFLGGAPTLSAADGSFRIEPSGLRDEDLSSGFLMAARRGPSGLWSGVIIPDEGQTATIKLWERRPLRLCIHGPDGEPETDLAPRLVFLGEGEGSVAAPVLPGNPWGKERCEGPDGDGVFVFPEVEVCSWGVRFQLGDGPTWTLPVAHPNRSSNDVVTVEFPGAVPQSVEVVQRADGTPIERACVTVDLWGGGFGGSAPLHSESVYTDASGHASVWTSVPVDEDDKTVVAIITVAHPRFGSQVESLEQLIEGRTAEAAEGLVTVQLGGSGAIEGRVTWGGTAPGRGILVAVSSDDRIGAPRTQITDEAGSFRFEGLAPGAFMVLAKDYSSESWHRFHTEVVYEPDSRSAVRTVEIKGDETQIVLFDFAGAGAPRLATLTGRITVNGEAPLRGRIGLESWEAPKFTSLDAAGRFEVSCDSGDDYVMGIFTVQTPLAATPVELTFYLDDFDLESPTSTGEDPAPQELDLEVVFVEVTVRGGPSGAKPIAGASCAMDLSKVITGETTTDRNGRLLLVGLFEGPRSISVECGAAGFSATSTAIRCGETDRYLRLDIELPPPVPCAGRCEGALSALINPKEAVFYIYDAWQDVVLKMPMGADQRFTFNGLGPGSYDVVLSDQEVILDAPLELTPEGATDLILQFKVR